jgi:hypothetical protein
MDTIKILEKLVEKLRDNQDMPRDAYLSGYNTGLSQAIFLLEEKIRQIKEIDN